jgi:predicted anti-sigma-YlaC factor YlaD
VSVDEIVCREFVELATDYLEGAMPEETLELVEEHLAMCDWCRDYLHQIETTAHVVAAEGEAPEEAPPAETLEALVGAFRERTGPGGPSR